ncbi:MAG: tRNA (guanosine(37)-N1)-methyltransferase TrmD [Gemmatimonadaceae bacterium]|nr:tRNA (guanosine(37)-N1)-methyltransferase TrmD [Gemmatimonadaceae bacterium]
MLTINIVTIFPEFFTGPLGLSIPARARAAGLVQVRVVDLRDHTHDRHRSVDDAPFGGGAGMVMRAPPFFEAVESLGASAPIVLLSPRGRRFAHADAMRFAAGTELTLLCGHYKDIDQRVADHLATEELSLGDFVLSGGEPAALAIVDAVVRLLPGALGDRESAETDSFYDRGISAPSYTRPAEFRGAAVPDVLVSGDHAKVAAWREAESLRLTRAREAADRAAQATRDAAAAARDEAIAAADAARAAKKARRTRRAAPRGDQSSGGGV